MQDDILNGLRRPTKRELLKVGFLANLIIHGKILLQKVWKLGIEWNSEITDEIDSFWKLFLSDLKKITKFELPRQYSPSALNGSNIQLHIF